MNWDVIVIGGGAIGLSVARELGADHSVLLLERGTVGREASWAAAGMLCPHGEAAGDDSLFRLGLASLSLYRSFVRELRDETGVDAEYADEGTLLIASTESEWADLEERSRWQRKSGFETSLLDPAAVRAFEPNLTMDIRGALFSPADHLVNPRLLVEGLRKACGIRGCEIRSGTSVDEVSGVNGGWSVRTRNGQFEAQRLVVTAGAWAGQIRGLEPNVDTRPRKGQILALASPVGEFRHVIRWRQFYLVPRRDGRIVVGATNEDCGFDRSVTVAGVRQLLEAAARMAAGLDSSPVLASWTGLRPETSDGMPVIGEAGVEGLFYAFGHYRNGILLTPVTARIIGDMFREKSSGRAWTEFYPARFSSKDAARN